MRIGVTGHQSLEKRLVAQGETHSEALVWGWVERAFSEFLAATTPREDVVISSLAAGADQRLARVAIDQGAKIEVVVPSNKYVEAFVSIADRAAYEQLFRHAKDIVYLDYPSPSVEAFLAAGHYVVDHCEMLVAVWDGLKAEGLGGTADIVAYSQLFGRPILHIDPIRRVVSHED